MSQERFIRCPHCGLPHEAAQTRCPVTAKTIDRSSKPRPRGKPPPSEEDYSWEHSIHPWSRPEGDDDPAELQALVGKVVENKYRVDALIGRGGMGAVFRAENLRIRKIVALKVLSRGYAPGSEAEKRFLREARVAGSLGHPNIVEVFDLGHLDDGKPFQVMELLEGQSLAERIRNEGALPETEALDIFEQVLSALEAAHDRGVIHRDLKPENVFLAQRGATYVAKLLDFGVSKSLTEQSLAITMTGAVVGTPYYLSPEQARGERSVDLRVDIWAMGVLMYETLTGMLPFRAKSYDELLTKILKTQPMPPTQIRPRLGQAIEAVVLRALAQRRTDRYEDSREMLAALQTARAHDAARAEQRFRELELGVHGAVTIQHALDGPEDPTEVSDSFIGADMHMMIKPADE